MLKNDGPPVRAVIAILALTTLASCRAKDPLMSSHDAARWLKETCGVTFTLDPVVLSSNASGPISATVTLPAADIEATLKSLRNDSSLHSRGQSETRFSYESYPGTGAAKMCELDTALGVLYFSYTEQ